MEVQPNGELEVVEDRVVKGYYIIWGHINEHRERVHKGATLSSIRNHGPESRSNFKIKFLNNHAQKEACALIAKMGEDERGAWFETKPLDPVPWADHLLTQIRSGTITNYSYGFDFVWDKVKWNEEEEIWDLYELRIFEISAATIPSGMETFTYRSKNSDYHDAIESFIRKLPKKFALEARKMFAYQSSILRRMPQNNHKDLSSDISNKKRKKTLEIDYNYLIKNL